MGKEGTICFLVTTPYVLLLEVEPVEKNPTRIPPSSCLLGRLCFTPAHSSTVLRCYPFRAILISSLHTPSLPSLTVHETKASGSGGTLGGERRRGRKGV
eukprot:s425_g31.t1